jgi:putative peptidoglycan lipid II flippase
MTAAPSPLRSSAVLGVGTMLSRITGLVRVAVTAFALGETVLADTYNAANTTPNVVYELILGGVLTATLVPTFVDLRSSNDRSGDRSILTLTIGAAGLLLVGVVIAAPLIVRVQALQLDGPDRAASIALGTSLVRWFAPQILGYAFTAVAAAALNARGRFVAAAYAPVLNNVVVTLVLLAVAADDPVVGRVTDDRGLTLALGLGTTAGILAMAAVLVPSLRSSGFDLRPQWQPRHPAVVRVARQAGWTLGYVIANQFALVVVQIIARGEAGAYSAYQYGFVFFQLPYGLVTVSIMTVWLPTLVRQWRDGDRTAMARRFVDGRTLLLLLLMPAAAGYLALSKPTVDTLLSWGDFEPRQTAAALSGFALGLVPFSLYLYTLRAFYALGDTRTPCLINIGENTLNVALAPVLFDRFGVRGLAISYTVAYFAAAVVADRILAARLGSSLAVPTRLVVVVVAASALCGGVAWAVADALGSPLVALLAAVAGGAVVYVLVIGAGARGQVGTLLRELRSAPEPPASTVGV